MSYEHKKASQKTVISLKPYLSDDINNSILKIILKITRLQRKASLMLT